jgi:lipopolysaccharide export LptBFGC system permease protein LptF
MKITGILVGILAALFLLVAIQLAVTKYDLRNTDQMQQCIGSFVPGLLLLALGIYLFRRGSKPPAPPRNHARIE